MASEELEMIHNGEKLGALRYLIKHKMKILVK